MDEYTITLTYSGDLTGHDVEAVSEDLVHRLTSLDGVVAISSLSVDATVSASAVDLSAAIRLVEPLVDESIEASGLGHLRQVRVEVALAR